MVSGNFSFANFIIAVYALINAQIGSNLFLRKVVIFSQISQAGIVHIITSESILQYYQTIVLILLSKSSKIALR